MTDYNGNGYQDAEDAFMEYAFFRAVQEPEENPFTERNELGCAPGLLAFFLFLLVVSLFHVL